MTEGTHLSLLNTTDAEAKFSSPDAFEAIPTDIKRIIVPVYGFSGGEHTTRPEWGPDGQFDENVVGIKFYNPKDNATQVLKQKDGCLICYDAPGRKEAIDGYLKANPEAVKTEAGIKGLIGFMTELTGDVWDTDTNFSKGLHNAPKEIGVGQIFSAVKIKEVAKAFEVPAGTLFAGPASSAQKADAGGAFIIKDSAGMRMVQADAFHKAYESVNTRTETKEATVSQVLRNKLARGGM